MTTQETGARFATSRLDAHGVTSCIMTGDFARAERYLKAAAGTISGARVVYLAHSSFGGLVDLVVVTPPK